MRLSVEETLKLLTSNRDLSWGKIESIEERILKERPNEKRSMIISLKAVVRDIQTTIEEANEPYNEEALLEGCLVQQNKKIPNLLRIIATTGQVFYLTISLNGEYPDEWEWRICWFFVQSIIEKLIEGKSIVRP